ncbi:hypothetical protein [Microtetraspora sp. NBRC 16547]|uniref:hypothetical protein n=1 Tax=Microtetraspora sp. NBRC 16547 TaxID=3030993 RepID=UPI0024A129D6|nr:hypothetical protein [Microtetraspora sp. NBRC 16547]GLW99410.1 hypothetical protein Misp02_34970 [Microtetraspora sp. NBRC 16547]
MDSLTTARFLGRLLALAFTGRFLRRLLALAFTGRFLRRLLALAFTGRFLRRLLALAGRLLRLRFFGFRGVLDVAHKYHLLPLRS